MFAYLKELEHRSRLLPSILATRAEYLEDPLGSRDVVVKAYSLSRDGKDRLNALYSATSLADLYLSELKDPNEAERWLSLARDGLKECGDKNDIAECDRLERALAALRAGE